jgi:hypothetical protein
MWARFAAVGGAHALVLSIDFGATAIVLTNLGRNALGHTAKRFRPKNIIIHDKISDSDHPKRREFSASFELRHIVRVGGTEKRRSV